MTIYANMKMIKIDEIENMQNMKMHKLWSFFAIKNEGVVFRP